MHHKAADDHVDAVVLERQVGGVGGVHLDAVGDPFELGVAQSVLLPNLSRTGIPVRARLRQG
jgi:hypothetical protein